MAELSALRSAGYAPAGDLGGALSLAGTGASVGSVFGPIGTIVGGVLGGVVGLFAGGEDSPDSAFTMARHAAVDAGWIPGGTTSRQAFRKLLAEQDPRALQLAAQFGMTQAEYDKQVKAFIEKGGVISANTGVSSLGAVTAITSGGACDTRAETILVQLVQALYSAGVR